jgi:hypothetical protein
MPDRRPLQLYFSFRCERMICVILTEPPPHVALVCGMTSIEFVLG